MPKTPETKASKRRSSLTTHGGRRKQGSKGKQKNVLTPKLPLYSTSSSRSSKPALSCSKDDILKHVRAIEDADKVIPKRRNLPVSTAATNKFLPCSLLESDSLSCRSAFDNTFAPESLPLTSHETAENIDREITKYEKNTCVPIAPHSEVEPARVANQLEEYRDQSHEDAAATSSLLDMSDFPAMANRCKIPNFEHPECHNLQKNVTKLPSLKSNPEGLENSDHDDEDQFSRCRSPTINIFACPSNDWMHLDYQSKDLKGRTPPSQLPSGSCSSRFQKQNIGFKGLAREGFSKGSQVPGDTQDEPEKLNDHDICYSSCQTAERNQVIFVRSSKSEESLVETATKEKSESKRPADRSHLCSPNASFKNEGNSIESKSRSGEFEKTVFEVPAELPGRIPSEMLNLLVNPILVPSSEEENENSPFRPCNSTVSIPVKSSKVTQGKNNPEMKDLKPARSKVNDLSKIPDKNVPDGNAECLSENDDFILPRSRSPNLLDSSFGSLGCLSPKVAEPEASVSKRLNFPTRTVKSPIAAPVSYFKKSPPKSGDRLEQRINSQFAKQEATSSLLNCSVSDEKKLVSNNVGLQPINNPQSDFMTQKRTSENLVTKEISNQGDPGISSSEQQQPSNTTTFLGQMKPIETLGNSGEEASSKSRSENVTVNQPLQQVKDAKMNAVGAEVELKSAGCPQIGSSKCNLDKPGPSKFSGEVATVSTFRNGSPLNSTFPEEDTVFQKVVNSTSQMEIDFIGASFKSASGKSVNISHKSLSKMKALASEFLSDAASTSFAPTKRVAPEVQEAASDMDAQHDIFSKPETPARKEIDSDIMFKSTSGKTVKASQKSFDKITAMARDYFNEASSLELTQRTSHEPSNPRAYSYKNVDDKTLSKPDEPVKIMSPSPITFKSASGKTVKPSENSLIKIKAIASEFFDDATISSSFFENSPVLDSVKSKAASGKDGNSFRKVPSKLDEPMLMDVDTFQSASGKTVEASQKGLNEITAIAKDYCDEISSFAPTPCSTAELTNQRAYIHQVVDANDKTLSKPGKQGLAISFTSASGKPVKPSETSLKKMSALASEFCCDTKPHGELMQTSAHIVQSTKENYVESIENSGNIISNPRQAVPGRVVNPLNSPEWEDFPDLAFSQAVILDKFLSGQASEGIGKENVKVPVYRGNSMKQGDRPLQRQINLSNVANISKEAGLENLRKRKPPQDSLNPTQKRCRPETSPTHMRDIQEQKLRLRQRQNEIIEFKDSHSISAKVGLLSKKKEQSGRLKLEDFKEEISTISECNLNKIFVKAAIEQVTSENAVNFRFHSKDQLLCSGTKIKDGDTIADACMVVFADDDTAGLTEISTAFLTSPHVSPHMVPRLWLKNHFRWIVWKLACLERMFPEYLYCQSLTVENVLLQLKYRYDREIDHVQRSAFRSILEGDAAPNRFVCCVSSAKRDILDGGEAQYELELTDGWYSIWTRCDEEMINLVKRNVISIGTKLMIHGAEITNCQQGCNPLQVPSDVKLKISANSTRRAKWYAKLGFTQKNAPIPTLLCTLLPNGGRIGLLTAVVIRKYPLIYLCKDSDGKTVSRSERSMAILNELRRKCKSDEAEQIYSQLWKEVEERYRPPKINRKVSAAELSKIDNPEELYAIVDGMDDEYLNNQLTAEQVRSVTKYKESLISKIKDEVDIALKKRVDSSESEMKVTKLLKVRLLDFISEEQAMLTIWRPNEDDLCNLREDKSFDFYNLDACGIRDKVLQLSNLKRFHHVQNDRVPPVDVKFKRTVTPIGALSSTGFTPMFDEIDIVGIVVYVKKPPCQDSGGVTVVYLVDEEGNCMSITFWTSLSVFGCEDIVKEGSVISGSNLQWRPLSNQRAKMPLVFAKEFTCFSLNPKQLHLQEALHIFKTKLAEKNMESLLSSAKAFISQSARINVSSPSPTANRGRTNTQLTPAQERLKLLNRYGSEAPTLSPMPMLVNTKHVFQNFKSPYRTPAGKSKQHPRRQLLNELPSTENDDCLAVDNLNQLLKN